MAFTTTHWSVVLTAQERSPAADAALEKLCRTYWWPLYGFVRRQGYSPEEAQDLRKVFSRWSWSEEISVLFVVKRGGCVRICWFRSKTSLEKHTVGPWP